MIKFVSLRRRLSFSPRRMTLAVGGLLLMTILGLCAAWANKVDNDTPKATPPKPPRDGKQFQILFVGNSLTGFNNVPATVQAMAAAGGVKVNAVAVTINNYSLEDHWKEANGKQTLASKPWDYVVLQQGPSSRPESQVNLREWAQRWADEARHNGVTPALYMVWPFKNQRNGFELVSKSYRAAAKASKATILPAGEAWREALRNDPSLTLYTPDDLHATPVGSYLAALVITYELTGVAPRTVPGRLHIEAGRDISLPSEKLEKLRQAAEKVHAE